MCLWDTLTNISPIGPKKLIFILWVNCVVARHMTVCLSPSDCSFMGLPPSLLASACLCDAVAHMASQEHSRCVETLADLAGLEKVGAGRGGAGRGGVGWGGAAGRTCMVVWVITWQGENGLSCLHYWSCNNYVLLYRIYTITNLGWSCVHTHAHAHTHMHCKHGKITSLTGW